MQTLFPIWLALTVALNLYICWRWTTTGFVNFAIKLGFFAVAVFAIILAYHHYALNLPIG